MALLGTRFLYLEEEILLGGQAVLEGVMMRAPRSMAVAVRKPNGEIAILRRKITILGEKYPILKWPVLRGAVVMIQALVLGISSLNFSAEAAFEGIEEEERKKSGGAKGASAQGQPALHGVSAVPAADAAPSANDPPVKAAEKAGTGATFAIVLSLVASLAVGLALFFLLPLAMTDLVKSVVPALQNSIVYNLVDGLFRIVVFLAYLYGISLLKDIKRVFEYHGAEHKTVFAHEAGVDLSVENVRSQSRLHPRCGTSFLLYVMVVSILVFSLLPTHLPFYVMIFPRLAMVPLIAGLSYEAIRWSARRMRQNRLARALVRPGMWLQRLTTREPDDSQIDVAIRALREALDMERRGGLPAVPA